jgi:predicted Fe-Mo cluster-binding NifX family protein
LESKQIPGGHKARPYAGTWSMNFPDGHELAFTQKYLKENTMNSTIVAIPSSHPGGLDAALGAHFGHCDLYTVVKIADGAVQEVKTLPNVPHQQGGCMAPVNHLAQNGVQVLIAGGMGMRPLMGFNQVGIDVLYGAGAQTVGEAVDALLRGSLQQFTREFTCGGGAPQPGRI